MSKPTWELPSGFEARDAWHADIDALGVMAQAESARLCALAQAGDLAARNAVVEGNLRLCELAARKYHGAGLDYEDRVQEGMFGLIRATETYRPGRGHFSTWAMVWIRQAISRAIDDRARLIRRPAGVEIALRQARRQDSDPRLSATRIEGAEATEYIDRLERSLNTHHGLWDQSGDQTLGDLVPDERPTPEELVSEADAADDLRQRLSEALPPRLLLVVSLHYGLDGYTDAKGHAGRSLQAIARLWGITRERVRQLEAEALTLLRQRLEMDRDGLVVLARRLRSEHEREDAA